MNAKMAKRRRLLWGLLYAGAFLAAFLLSAIVKLTVRPVWAKDYTVAWSDSMGTVCADLAYGDGAANKFDLYLPADGSRDAYGLVVYLHAGGFTSGDKSDDVSMLQWLCSKGYVAAGINYTLRDEAHPEASVYSQSMEIKESIPHVLAEAEARGYPIGEMAVSGGSAGGCLALLYAYRDADSSPVPVKMVFEAVGPSSFYPEDWTCYGLDQSPEAAAGLFSVMAGKEIPVSLLGTPAYDDAIRDISALLWVDRDTVPTLMAYGAHDTIQSFEASERLAAALEAHGVPYDYIVCQHSGHGLQNDDAQYRTYMRLVEEYLETYIPVS